MNAKVRTALGRLELYVARAKDALERGDPHTAMPHLAELAEIARRLWLALAAHPDHEVVPAPDDPGAKP